MNINEYISSGILEAYALGDLSEQERASVEKNLVQYPELHEELKLIEETQEKLLMRVAIQPKPGVKAQLFQKVQGPVKSEAKVVPLVDSKSGLSFWQFAAAASITIAVVASYLAFLYWNKWKDSEASLSNLITQNQRIAQDYNQVNERLDKIEKDLNVINDPAFQRIVMTGTANAPDAMAHVYWNPSTKEVYLSIQNMKELARENQYQLWAIIDGKPVDAGVFNSNVAEGLVKMKDIEKGAATFAVTVEPKGGKESPTLETMQVAGNVKG